MAITTSSSISVNPVLVFMFVWRIAMEFLRKIRKMFCLVATSTLTLLSRPWVGGSTTDLERLERVGLRHDLGVEQRLGGAQIASVEPIGP